ncbi:hypothetical protein [Burkholderia pyrrocinia]|uniref:hypothetical protein n=1 Tax=Burkholderia pyrrocinia TaxID=60550 RepID=UPI001269DBDB|nr:hypothetical protein [Burkholderia pyrrocinia]
MLNQIQIDKAAINEPAAFARAILRRRFTAGVLSVAMAAACAFTMTAHATTAPCSLSFAKASNDLPIVMPICCQSRTR